MNQEKPSPVELSPEMRIRGCVNLDELYSVIHALGTVQGSRRVHSAEEIVSAIKQATELHISGAKGVVPQALAAVTNGLGIRDKARELIEKLPVQAEE